MEKVKNNLLKSTNYTLILSIVFGVFLVLSIFISIFYNQLVSAVRSEISAEFADILETKGMVSLILIFVLYYILTIPFFIYSLTATIKTKKLVKNNLNEANRDNLIELSKNAVICLTFALAFVIGVLVAYFTLHIGNIWFMLIPYILTLPFFILATIYKFQALKYLDELYRK